MSRSKLGKVSDGARLLAPYVPLFLLPMSLRHLHLPFNNVGRVTPQRFLLNCPSQDRPCSSRLGGHVVLFIMRRDV